MGVARIAILALAVVAAAFAALLVQGIVGSKQKSPQVAQAKPDLVAHVLVAAHDLPLGHVVAPGDMKWMAWPETALSPAYVVKKTSEGALENTTGATVRQAMLTGEPVTQSKVVKSENAGFMAAMLSPGSRAVSVKISAETGAGGFILPNDRVDVLVTTQGSNGREHYTRTVLANVRVLAIDQSFREEGDQRVVVGKTATLELEPSQAEMLAQSEAAGSVSLALRSLADINADKTKTLTPVASGAVTMLRYGSVSHVSVSGASQ